MISALQKRGTYHSLSKKTVFQKECHSEERSDVGIRTLNAVFR